MPLTLENIVNRNRAAFDAAISPDGRWVAVTANGPAGLGIYLVSTEAGAAEPRLWVKGSSPSWFADSRRIVFVRDNDLWTATVGAAGPSRLTSDSLDERAPIPSPNGEQVAYYSGRSGHQDIWLVAATGTGAPRRLTEAALPLDDPRFKPAWSPDGRMIAYISNRNDEWADNLWVVEVESGTARQLSRTMMATTAPAWSPDGREIALLGTSKQGYWYEDLSDIYVVDAGTGAERVVPMQVNASDWLFNHRVIWSNEGRTLLFPYLERGDFNLWAVPAAGGVATRVTNGGGYLGSMQGSASGDAVVMTRSTELLGGDVYLISAGGGSLRQLTHFAERWADVTAPEEISFRSYDGLYIQAFLYRPPGASSGGRFPALVSVHGGGTNSYIRGQNLLEQYLASKGYAVLAINYRGGSGFGRPFQDLSINDWANGQARDAAEAARFLRRQPYSNGKVGIYGYSYGGITTMAAIAREPNAFDVAVPMAGIYDFADAYLNADRIGRIFIRTGHGGSPEERPEVYAVSNTLSRLRHVRTPLLVMHGEADVRAPYRQYLRAVDSLTAHGKTFAHHSYPGEPHGFRNPANRLDLDRRLEAFLQRYLKP